MTDADLSEWSDFGVGVALAAGLVSSWVLLGEI
jgi:hypothetical protein